MFLIMSRTEVQIKKKNWSNSSAMRQKDIKYCVGACSLNSILYLFGIWRSATARKLCFSTVFELEAELLRIGNENKTFDI